MRGPAARRAQRALGSAAGDVRSAVLRRLAHLLEAREPSILAANARDLEAAEADGVAAPLVKRLALSAAKLTGK